MSGPLLLLTWEQLASSHPDLVATMRRYLAQIGAVLRPGSVDGADLAPRSFAAFLLERAPAVTCTAQLTRGHLEDYKPWLAARPGQGKARVTPASIARRLGTLQMFFVRIDEWGRSVASRAFAGMETSGAFLATCVAPCSAPTSSEGQTSGSHTDDPDIGTTAPRSRDEQ